MVLPFPVPPVVGLLLNGDGYYLHWGFFRMSLANLVVVVLMIVVFVAALLAPFPHGRRRSTPPGERS